MRDRTAEGGCPHMYLFELFAEGGELLLDFGQFGAEAGDFFFE